MRSKKCRECDREAVLVDLEWDAQAGTHEAVFICPAGHREEAGYEPTRKKGKPHRPRDRMVREDDLSSLEKLNDFLDELEGKPDG